jgi:hypothetical protein
MGGVLKSTRAVIDPFNIMDPLGVLPGPKANGKYGSPSWKNNENRKKRIAVPTKGQLMLEKMQLERDRANRSKGIISQQTDAIKQPAPIVPQVLQDIQQPELKPATQVQPNLTNAIPTPVAATAAIAPLANQATGMAQQKINQFAMPNASGLKFGGV